MQFDATGKVSLEQIYTQPDPRPYFGTLRELEYRIPQLAKPHFLKLIQEYRHATGIDVPTVLDIGCSYGINAALLRCDATIDELYAHYCGADAPDRSGLLARDRDWISSRRQPKRIRFVGLDNSKPALSYALAAGFIDDAVHADLEEHAPTEQQREQLAKVDLVISTGCIGYVGEKTLTRIADASNKPWMAHYVLRMFPFGPIARRLAELGYETGPTVGLFKQRRFVSPQEQSLVLDTLSAVGVDPRGLEADGWLYARLHISRPRNRPASYGIRG
ncbi:class I SAM-dependent methyltransferase [Saccharopolyspora phatthalungensis]|uniref:Carnitine O-acetyltransferase n=1 Tax=Saccharopolyspora phatthalungensis TaxID=664693 RepID=A0A840Q7B5_9PSEU|nr:class I SAM-dependent methyltransferase [Saccharopolyspora phatthalungensis]MBB5158402.1 carnitine O-acetyltransferase [Saccharopolyspora phatthalungensis]